MNKASEKTKTKLCWFLHETLFIFDRSVVDKSDLLVGLLLRVCKKSIFKNVINHS